MGDRGSARIQVITAMAVPDHSTIAEFRRRHETAIGELFVSVLSLCGEAGLVQVGEMAVDGTGCARTRRGTGTEGMSRS
jgi:transposase